MKSHLRMATFGFAILLFPRTTVAEESAPHGPCDATITRTNVTACALAGNPLVREALADEKAAEGRSRAARPFLPSNPSLTGYVSSRANQVAQATNWSLTVGQELEVAGQSWLRADVAGKELRAQKHRVDAARRDVVAQAWTAYFTALAIRERLRLAEKLEVAASSVSTTVRAMAATGLTSEVDADIAETAALRATTDRLTLESQRAAANAQLNRLIGSRTGLSVEGPLDPLKLPGGGHPEDQPSLLAIKAQQTAAERKVSLLQRERIPNPTLTFFAQNDGFEERVLGVGLSVPIPLLQPIGRTGAGQVAEATALAEGTKAEVERTRRELQAERVIAMANFDAASRARALYPPERMQRAVTRLEAIATQVKAARLPVRDALLAQQALVEQLKAEIDTREALCLASVRLGLAAGTSLEGDSL